MSEAAGAVPDGGSPFSGRAVLVMLLFGALAFIAALYLIGTGSGESDKAASGAHAGGNGLDGYAAFARLLEARGLDVSFARSKTRTEERSLLILTPPFHADPDDINAAIAQHREWGPTILVLPKWIARQYPPGFVQGAKDGWVELIGADSPEWAREVGRDGLISPQLVEKPASPAWHGMGRSGAFPDPKLIQTAASRELVPLVSDNRGRQLAGFWNDGGHYPTLAYYSGRPPVEDYRANRNVWPLVVVAEPDLMNNYGMASRERAMLALALVEAAQEGQRMPVAFDLTLNGLGSGDNLLTLAFTPPFLAATLCLLIAAIVIGWRGMRRFGPPLAGTPVFAFGKRQLATNGAALIQRSKRFHLLGAPYAAMLRARIAQALGLRASANPALAEAEIDRLLALRGLGEQGFAENAEALRQAKGPHELLRRAHALSEIERKLAR